jgi:predicted HNH restriction endonuclease
MKRKELMDRMLIEFENWYKIDKERRQIGFYRNFFKKEYLEKLTRTKLIELFFDFVNDGGKLQSNGARTKDRFKSYIEGNFESFKNFILQPFSKDFDSKKWFEGRSNDSYFGFGISTIYLHRINESKFPIMNHKTIDALKTLGYNISTSMSYSNYRKTKAYQLELIKKYPELNNYNKVDALFQFLIGEDLGKPFLTEFKKSDEEYEQDLADSAVDVDKSPESLNDLRTKIAKMENSKEEYTIINGRRVKRNQALVAEIKKYRGFKCQFCNFSMKKKDGHFYIEACHIKAKSKKGSESLNNILILCPNCHKLLDYGKRKEIKTGNKDEFVVILNGKRYSAKLS